MHIHLDENPARHAACESSETVPYVSPKTLAGSSNMTMPLTRYWVEIHKTPASTC